MELNSHSYSRRIASQICHLKTVMVTPAVYPRQIGHLKTVIVTPAVYPSQIGHLKTVMYSVIPDT